MYRQFRFVARVRMMSLVRAVFILPALFATPAHAATVAGATPGQVTVTPTGAAQYAIPLVVPPGIGGIQPALALTYNSQSQNGLLGMGWNLSGLSTITRCPKTLIQDGVISGVNYDANDKYCLDGRRLVAVSGTYGADGTEYRTERDTFSRIVSYGAVGTTGPASFKVWTKSGQVLEYGNTADSAIEAQGKTAIRVWAVNKISDAKSNYLTVTYTEDNTNGQYYPARIDYTGNTATGIVPLKSVQFGYETRPDVVPIYEAGSLQKTTVRMTHIKTYVGVNVVKNYQLAYDTSTWTNRSRLISLAECDGAASPTCFQATTMGWQSGGATFAAQSKWVSDYSINYGWTDENTLPRMMVDVDGDGRADVVGFASDGVYVSLSTGTQFAARQKWVSGYGTSYGWTDQNTVPRMMVDVNGDGKADVVGFASDGVYVSLSTGTGFTAPQKWVSGYGTNSGWTGQNTLPRMMVDVNGDGKDDVVGFASDGVYVSLSTGTQFTAQQKWVSGYGTNAGWTDQNSLPRMMVDVNGDGKDDVVGFASDGVYTSVSSGLLPDLLLDVSTGLGAVTSLTYLPLTDATTYTKDNTAVYPVQDVQNAMYVVSSLSISDGVGGSSVADYAYAGAKTHVRGGGFLGFRQVVATNAQTGIKTTTTYGQGFTDSTAQPCPASGQLDAAYPYCLFDVGLPLAAEQDTASAILRQTANTWNFPTNTAYGPQYHVPLLVQSNDTVYDLASNGAQQGGMVTQTTTCNTYDAYGNPTYTGVWSTSIASCATLPAKTGLFVNETNNTYLNDTTNWFLGRLTGSTVTKSTP